MDQLDEETDFIESSGFSLHAHQFKLMLIKDSEDLIGIIIVVENSSNQRFSGIVKFLINGIKSEDIKHKIKENYTLKVKECKYLNALALFISEETLDDCVADDNWVKICVKITANGINCG